MSIKIMIADDHILFREGLKKLLESEPSFQVVGEAGNGKEILETINELMPDILLLDIRMPEMDGFETLVKIREKELDVKVIIITYHDEMDYLIRAINLGANGYLLKKTSYQELKDAITGVMKGERYILPNLLSQLTAKMTQQDKDKEKIRNLTRREMEVLRLLSVGMYNKEIAHNLDISERTVKNHISNIFKKIAVTDRTQAAVFAIKNNLITI